jgi:MFS transporter, PAT family, beta-lactamase induction signal transducer AmpG
VKSRRGPNPLLYFVLFLPFGASSGFVSVALGYLGRKQGLSVGEIAVLVSMTLVPQTFKVLWAPLTDVLWTRKAWYITANIISSLTVAALGFVPMSRANLPLLETMVLLNSLASTFVAMSVEAIMANATPDEERGRAGGFSQAGNLGGSGIGGGLGLIMAIHLPKPWMATTALALLLMLCQAALIPLPEPPKFVGNVVDGFKEVGRDLWRLGTSRSSVLALALCFLPAGAGAASGLFSSIAESWHASENLVSIMNGTLSGVIMIAGCLAAAPLSDAMNRKGAYALAGAILAVVTAIIALMPRTPVTYAVLCVAYSFVGGLTYGTFTAFVLEAIGGGAAATKYNLMASLSNFPIWYMTRFDGLAADHWGPTNMLLFDAGAGVVGLVLLGLVALALKLLWPQAAPLPKATVVE